VSLSTLAIAALGLLNERSMHPYEMFQLLIARGEDKRVKVRPGTLYHTVDRLNEQGLVRAIGTERAGNRPERTTYAITTAGQDALQQWVRDSVAVPVNDYPVFRVAISEMHNLTAGEAITLLQRRIAQLRADETLAADAFERVVVEREVPERYMLDADYERAVLAAERSWLERLVQRITDKDIDWPGLTQPASQEGNPAS
jgi:DNA-binding PadR family transcriptional regulator